jgi:hypothetical protein
VDTSPKTPGIAKKVRALKQAVAFIEKRVDMDLVNMGAYGSFLYI